MHDLRQISCPMCGRPVTASENGPVPCPSCGVPVSAPAAASVAPVGPTLAEDDSATRVATLPPPEPAPMDAPAPVVAAPVVAAPVAPVAGISDTADPRTQPVSEAVVQQVAYPPAAEQTPAVTPAPQQPITQAYQYAPPQQPATQTYPSFTPPVPQAAPAAPKRNPALLIVGVVVAVVVLLAIVGAAVVFANRIGLMSVGKPAATATTAATATSGIPTGFTQFTDGGNVYTINYPSAWKKSSTSGDLGLTIFAGTSQSHLESFDVEYVKVKADPKAFQDGFFKGLEGTGKVTNRQDPTTLALAGESWQRATADVTPAGSSAQHVVVLTANHGQYTVLIAYLAAKDIFDSADTQAFQPMLSSFQFVS